MIPTTILVIITALLIFWRFIFLRDPKREIPQGRVITSPADGKTIEIRKVKGVVKGKKGLGVIETLASDVAKECYLVAIFMNPTNVHD